MKLKFFALFLSLIVVLGALASCGNNNSKIVDTNEVETGAVTGDNVETTPVIEAGKLSVSAEVVGNQLIATVSLSENPGVAAFNVKLNYDNTKIMPVEIIDSELVDPYVISSNIQQGPEIVPGLTFATAFYANPSNFTGDGVLFTMSFDILEGATGETELTLTSAPGSNTNQNLEDIVFALEGCTVTLG